MSKLLTRFFGQFFNFAVGGEMSIQITNSIMYMIAVDNLPLSTVEHEGFRQFCKKVVPLYTVPSRKTITRLLDERYDALKKVYRTRFQRIQNITITTDVWTDVSMKSYVGVTVHYLNDELKFINSTIGVIPLDENHTADYIGCSIVKLCQEWNINADQITAVVTDSASNMVKAINDTYGRRKHLRCFAHTLSLVYPDALKATPHLIELISKIKRIVTLTKHSVVAADELRRLQMLEGKTEGTTLKLIQEVPTRWNSAFYMIQRFLELKHHMHGVLLKCPTAPNMISRDELSVLAEIVEILQPIEYVTRTIGGDSYATTSLVIPMTHCMTIAVRNCSPVTPLGISFRNNILKEFTKRFQHVESIALFAIATLLDPRFKKIHFESPMALSTTMKHVNNMIGINSEKCTDQIVQPNASVVDSDDQASFWNVHDTLVASKRTASDDRNEHDIELKQFLTQPVIPRTSDPIEYWKVTKHAYPKLYPIAIQHLSVVGTSVPAERLFSKAGLIKSDLRNRITGKRLSAPLFLSSVEEKDWNL